MWIALWADRIISFAFPCFERTVEQVVVLCHHNCCYWCHARCGFIIQFSRVLSSFYLFVKQFHKNMTADKYTNRTDKAG